MGLAFLNKKSWHTGSFKNIEKVWAAEQLKKEQDRKEAERGKKLKEERQNEELKKLQVQAGLLPASILDRQEWIYEWGNKLDKSKEEYLMGKPVEQKDAGKYPFTPLIKESEGNAQNEAFTKLHEDPLYLIRQEELKKRKEIVENPLKMREIYNDVEKVTDKKKKKKHKEKKEKKDKKEKKEKKDREKSEKKSKKEKKHKKERKRSSSSSASSRRKRSSSSRSSSSSSHSRSRDKSKDKSEQKKNSMFDEYMRLRLGPNVQINKEEFKPDFKINNKKKPQNQLSHEEKLKMVEEMKKNAEELSRSRKDFMKKHRADDKDKNQNGSTFIQHMKKDVYDKDTNVNSLGDRLSRNVHYLARNSDEGGNSYRK